MDQPRSWRWKGLLAFGIVAGPPAYFVLLSPTLALLGYATGWFAPGVIGDAVGLILLSGVVLAVLVAVVLAMGAAVVAVIGTVVAAIGSAIAHLFSRVDR